MTWKNKGWNEQLKFLKERAMKSGGKFVNKQKFPIPTVSPEDPYANGPLLWDKIIERVSGVYDCEAIIAGGAVRDYILGIQPKDIDVFVNFGDEFELELRMEELGRGWNMLVPEGDKEGYAEEDGSGFALAGVVEGFVEVDHTDRLPLYYTTRVQVIGNPCDPFTGEAVVSRFDLGMCQCWYENGEIKRTKAAEKDFNENTLTYIGPKDSVKQDRSYGRFQRIRSHVRPAFENTPKWVDPNEGKAFSTATELKITSSNSTGRVYGLAPENFVYNEVDMRWAPVPQRVNPVREQLLPDWNGERVL